MVQDPKTPQFGPKIIQYFDILALDQMSFHRSVFPKHLYTFWHTFFIGSNEFGPYDIDPSVCRASDIIYPSGLGQK